MGIETTQVNAMMEYGNAMEPRMVKTTEEKLGIKFDYTGKDQKKIKRGRLTVMPDGTHCRLHVAAALEGKCHVNHRVLEAIPVYYMCQVQGSMWLGGYHEIYFTSWCPERCRIWTVPRSDEFIGVMEPLIDEYFWWLDLGIPPPRMKKGGKPKMPEVKSVVLYEGPV